MSRPSAGRIDPLADIAAYLVPPAVPVDLLEPSDTSSVRDLREATTRILSIARPQYLLAPAEEVHPAGTARTPAEAAPTEATGTPADDEFDPLALGARPDAILLNTREGPPPPAPDVVEFASSETEQTIRAVMPVVRTRPWASRYVLVALGTLLGVGAGYSAGLRARGPVAAREQVVRGPAAAPRPTALHPPAPPPPSPSPPSPALPEAGELPTRRPEAEPLVPGTHAVARLRAALAPRIGACLAVHRVATVTIRIRYRGSNGAATAIDLPRGVDRMPLGDCIHRAVAMVRAPDFTARRWSIQFVFPGS